MNFGEHKPQLATAVEEQLLVQSAAQNERCGHLPISDDLAEPCVLLRAGWRIDHLDNLIGTTRPPSREPGARFTHFSFAAQIIEPHDDLCVFSSGFLWHFHSPDDGHGGPGVLARAKSSFCSYRLSILIRPLV